jgi:hypothetical protein
VADAFWRVPIESKMNLFEGEICGDNDFVSGWRTQDSAVIANPQSQKLIHRPGTASQGGNQRFFPDWKPGFWPRGHVIQHTAVVTIGLADAS